MSCGSPMLRGEQIAKPAERDTRLAGFFSSLDPEGFRRRSGMQGEKIAETSGKVTSQRVLPNPGGGPKMESSFAANGKLLGDDEPVTGTKWSAVRQDGHMAG